MEVKSLQELSLVTLIQQNLMDDPSLSLLAPLVQLGWPKYLPRHLGLYLSETCDMEEKGAALPNGV